MIRYRMRQTNDRMRGIPKKQKGRKKGRKEREKRQLISRGEVRSANSKKQGK